MTLTNSLVSHLPVDVLAAVETELDARLLSGWLRANADVTVPHSLAVRMWERNNRELRPLLAMHPLERATVDQLLATTQTRVTRKLAERGDLDEHQLERLLWIEDRETDQAVWNHPRCSDRLRRLMLSGRPLRPGSRADRLTRVHVTDQMSGHPELIATLDHTDDVAVARELVRQRRDPAGCCHGAAMLLRAAATHLHGNSPYPGESLALTVRTVRQAAQVGRLGPGVVGVLDQAGLPADKPDPDTLDSRWLEAAATALEQLATRPQDRPDLAQAHARLADGTATAADVAVLDGGLLGLDPDRLDRGMVDLLAKHAPMSLDLDWWRDLLAARRRTPGGRALPGPVARALLADGDVLPAARVSLDTLTVTQLASQVAPARTVLADKDVAEPVAGLLASRLGCDPTRWSTLLSLIDGHDGTLAALFDAVDVLHPAATATAS